MDLSQEASGTKTFNWRYEGRAWCFGDGIGVDGDLMALDFAIKRETRPDVLAAHVFEAIDPDFAGRAKPGDVVIAGKRFAHGNPHIQGLLGLRGLGLGVVAESIPSGSYRNCINAGLPFLAPCPDGAAKFRSGDLVSVDFSTGAVQNLSSGWEGSYTPVALELRKIIATGGWKPGFAARLERMSQSSVTRR